MGKLENIAPCGTEAAYNRHRRHGQTPCQECKRAAAAARARRRGAPAKDDTPMGERAPEAAQPAEDGFAGFGEGFDLTKELALLYGVLGAALHSAAPRETASIVKEMRGILHDVKAEKGPAQNGPSLAEQLAAAKAAKERKRGIRREATGDSA